MTTSTASWCTLLFKRRGSENAVWIFRFVVGKVEGIHCWITNLYTIFLATLNETLQNTQLIHAHTLLLCPFQQWIHKNFNNVFIP